MEKFIAYNPTRLHFGWHVVNDLGKTATQYGKKALVIYGKGSVKKYDILAHVTNTLAQAGIEFVEFGGIKPNPVIEDVRRAADLAKKENVDMIIAVGGGSVIDSAKITALAAKTDIDPWLFMEYKEEPKDALPLITVLTVAATGSEMNGAAVIQNHKAGKKTGFVSPLIYPKDSFLDPAYTLTVPPYQTACGISDIIAHSLEAFFADGRSPLADRFVASIINEMFEIGPRLVNDPANYDLRARMMLASTYALNGTTAIGRPFSGDWGTHDIGHHISLLYDTPHGATLSIAFPAWMKLQITNIPERIRELGKYVFGDDEMDCYEIIEKFEDFFKSIGLPTRLTDIDLGEKERDEIVELMKKNKAGGLVHKLSYADLEMIGDLMLKG